MSALVRRELVVEDVTGPGWRLVVTELGKRVYSRLAAGPMCGRCGKPLAFSRRIAVPGGGSECEIHTTSARP